MLTFEMLFAVLQGLPHTFIDFLDPPWVYFCEQIGRALKAGDSPVAALSYALENANDWQKDALKKALAEVQPVMEIPGLTFRQRETLIALRYAGAVSLSQLSRVLVQDPGNTHRRLTALVKKGLAIKFFRPGGVCYFAINSPINKSVKTEVYQIFNSLLTETSQAGEVLSASGR